MKIKEYVLTFFIFLVLIVSGCSNGDNEVSRDPNDIDTNQNNDVEYNNETEKEEVTILVATPWSDETFEIRFKDIDEKLDHITIEHVIFDLYGSPEESLQELFADDIIPDIITGLVEGLDLIYPLDDLIEKHSFDLDMIEPSLVSSLRSLDPEGENQLIGMPDGTLYAALYYNRDIFDLFGVSYPDPGEPMTWGEVLELTKQLTGTRDGTDYLGFDDTIGAFFWPLEEIPMKLTDPDTGEVLISGIPEFVEFFDYMDEFYSISDQLREIAGTHFGGSPFEERKAAMSIQGNAYLRSVWPQDENYESIDLAPIPVWENNPAAPKLGTTPMIINKYSENKEEAFQVLTEYVSPENQMKISRSMGSGPVVTDPHVLENFGADLEQYDGKNVAAYFATSPAIQESVSRWDKYVNINAAIVEIARGEKDVPTIIRELEEESFGKIQDAMGADK